MKVNGGSQILVGVSVAIFRKNGKENDPHIKSKAPVLKVEQIVLHALPDGGVAAPTVDLGPTGDAHLQAMTTVVPRHFVEEFCDKARALGPRPDNTHITLQNRSEEHTSELQSRLHLVCRLLLEQKKTTHTS